MKLAPTSSEIVQRTHILESNGVSAQESKDQKKRFRFGNFQEGKGMYRPRRDKL
jgi:hypothetical protein